VTERSPDLTDVYSVLSQMKHTDGRTSVSPL